jgi:Domain of unknown function (DUF4430)
MALYHNVYKKGRRRRVTRQVTIVIPGVGEILVTRQMTLERAMQQVDYVVRNCPGLGYFVQEIQGCAPPQGQYWLFRVNGKLAHHGLSDQIIDLGDKVEWFQSGVLPLNTI